ncbi:HAD family hydrolase [Yoonia maricola]|nr:HAD-IA family hydrolase [Yoonia maricola]
MLDVDGVLVFGRPRDGQHWMVGLEDDLGVPPRELANRFFRAEWNDVVVGRAELLPALQRALDEIAPSVFAENLIAYWFEMSSRIVQPVLSDLRKARQKGTPVYLATNQDHTRADYLMNNLGLRHEVDGIVYSARAGYKKPDAEFYSFAEKMTGYRPSELIMVDDTLPNVEAATAMGWLAVHWTCSESLSAILQRSIG